MTAEGRRVDEPQPVADVRLTEFKDYFDKLEWSRGKAEMWLARVVGASREDIERLLRAELEKAAAPAASTQSAPPEKPAPPPAAAEPAKEPGPAQRLMDF